MRGFRIPQATARFSLRTFGIASRAARLSPLATSEAAYSRLRFRLGTSTAFRLDSAHQKCVSRLLKKSRPKQAVVRQHRQACGLVANEPKDWKTEDFFCETHCVGRNRRCAMGNTIHDTLAIIQRLPELPTDGDLPIPEPDDETGDTAEAEPAEQTAQADEAAMASAATTNGDAPPLPLRRMPSSHGPRRTSAGRYSAGAAASLVERRFDYAIDAATVNSSRSLYADDFNFVWENGRKYCGSYYMPVDEDELVRNHLVQETFTKFFDGRLTTVPLESPRLILDVGTGNGDWAIGMAEQYPEAEVIGTDIAPVQETGSVPHNVFFEIDDAEMEWTRAPDSIDFIHVQNMLGAFENWRYVYSQCFACLRPGGWIEVVDQDDAQMILGCFAPDAEIVQLSRRLKRASAEAGRPRDAAHLQPSVLEAVGFVDVQTKVYDLPLDPRETKWGKFWLLACLVGVEAMCLRLFTKFMGLEADEVRRACARVEQEVKTLAEDPVRCKGVTYQLRVLMARKPDTAGEPLTIAPPEMQLHEQEDTDRPSTPRGEVAN